VSVLLILAAGACDPAAVADECASDDECPTARCVDGRCVEPADAAPRDAGGSDGGSTCDCGPGAVCRSDACVPRCQSPEAEACAAGDECDFASGACVPEGSPGILSGDPVTCPDGTRCLPGSECSLEGGCVPAPPCFALECTDDDATCWGQACQTARPEGACAPAPLSRMNMADFIAGGDGGAFDLEFDDACNAYVVTMISGTDYLRQLAPDGTLTVWDGVTNLNMGEVAVRRIEGSEFGMGDGEGQVALTYVCCASCGCVGSDPQGVARLDRVDPSTSLPMVVIASPSEGAGPFGNPALDTGPFGLTWGRDNTLYVGNVEAVGDLVRADLDTGASRELHRLPSRVHASAVFSRQSLLVAVEGGVVHRVSTVSDARVVWADLGEDVTSLVRDPFTGRVYASLASGRVVEHAADGAALGEWEDPGLAGRLAYAPDGHLYYLVSGWPTTAEVRSYPLPSTR